MRASIYGHKALFCFSVLAIGGILALCFNGDDILIKGKYLDSPHSAVNVAPQKERHSSQPVSNDASLKSVDLNEGSLVGQSQLVQKFPAAVTINLPNGATIERLFDITGYAKLPRMTDENVEMYLGKLETLSSEGNGAAAYELYNLLKRCGHSARNESEYRTREASILSQGERNIPLSVDDQLLANRMTYLLCNNVSDTELEKKEKWRKLALENHSLMAMNEEARKLLFESPARAGEIYKELWNRGHATTGHALSYVYRVTDFDGRDPSKPNLVKAHAYRIAKDIVDQQFLQEQGGINLANKLSEIEQGQAMSAAMLSPQEQKEAESLASELLMANESCCVDEWNFR